VSSLGKGTVSMVVAAVLALGVFAVIACRQYQKTVLQTREAVLREDLAKLRAEIREFTLKHESPPQSLDDLVKSGYLREVPVDPITEKRDWQVTQGEVERESKKVTGIVNVHSASRHTASDGTPYNQW
jgi:general secretion pathway protein G